MHPETFNILYFINYIFTEKENFNEIFLVIFMYRCDLNIKDSVKQRNWFIL